MKDQFGTEPKLGHVLLVYAKQALELESKAQEPNREQNFVEQEVRIREQHKELMKEKDAFFEERTRFMRDLLETEMLRKQVEEATTERKISLIKTAQLEAALEKLEAATKDGICVPYWVVFSVCALIGVGGYQLYQKYKESDEATAFGSAMFSKGLEEGHRKKLSDWLMLADNPLPEVHRTTLLAHISEQKPPIG